MKRTTSTSSLTKQVRAKVSKVKTKMEYDGDTGTMISTGSTLLDLAISGGRVRGGGIPGGILVEAFGPSSAGKTVLLCEIAGAVQRQGGQVSFKDPEARLNKQFARIFDLDVEEIEYDTPDTVPQVFKSIRDWEPKSKKVINGIFADSLAALSTDMEMGSDDGDKMGMRRAKEFSEELRRTARIITKENYLMVASNQVRENTTGFGHRYKSPGGEAIGFYSSLRLRFSNPEKIKQKVKVVGKEVTRIIGVFSQVEVFKSSVWKPFRSAPVFILFDYGVDDIRANLQFIKDFTKNTLYTVNGERLAISIDESIAIVEAQNLEKELKEEVIDLWEEIELKFEKERKGKKR